MNTKRLIFYNWNYEILEFPVISKSKFTKDFSWGFYCTTIKKQAENFASKFNTPIVNVYEIKNTNSLNVKEFNDYCDEWLDFVVNCRSGATHEYDVVIGPIADDTIYDYIDAYSHKQMNKQKFFELMKSKYSANQISIHTIKALNYISFIESYALHKNQ